MHPGSLRAYRDSLLRQPPVWLLVLLAVFWGVSEWGEPGYEDPAEVVESVERCADVSLTLAEKLGEWRNPVALVLSEGDPGEISEWVTSDLAEEDLRELTDVDEFFTRTLPEDADEWLLASLALTGDKPTAGEWARLEEDYDGLPLYRWEADALRELAGDAGPEWVAETVEVRGEMERWMVTCTLAAAAATLAAILLGLPGLSSVGKALRSPESPRRAMAMIPWRWVCLTFLVAELVANWLLTRAYDGLVYFEDWPFALDVFLDAVWRIGGAVLLVGLLFPRWRDAWRLFGLDRPWQAKVSLGMLAVLLMASSAWYPVALEWFPDSAALLFDEDGWGGLGYALLSGVVLAPVCEEIVFRGCLFGGLWSRIGFWPATLLSSAVFSSIHHYGVAGSVGVFGIGVAACVLFRHTKSLKGPMLVHAAYNFLITLAVWPVYQAPYSV